MFQLNTYHLQRVTVLSQKYAWECRGLAMLYQAQHWGEGEEGGGWRSETQTQEYPCTGKIKGRKPELTDCREGRSLEAGID